MFYMFNFILEMSNIDAYYGSFHVLKDVNIKLPLGRTLAIVGESGSGKSTMARVITGLLEPKNGIVSYKNQALPPKLKNRSKDQLQRIQMIYQMADVAMNPKQTVFDIISRPAAFFTGLSGRQLEDRVIELLKQIDLDESFVDRFPSELSGGQKQRAAIARALVSNAEFILLDEPLVGIDRQARNELLKLLDKFCHENEKTILMVSHDLSAMRQTAHRMIYLEETIHFDGPSDTFPALLELADLRGIEHVHDGKLNGIKPVMVSNAEEEE